MPDSYATRLDNLLRHIDHVRSDCIFLGKKLIEAGEAELGLAIIAQGAVHDASKFKGIEWEYLNDGAFPYRGGNEELFRAALKQHVSTNPHHPEFWGGIEEMATCYLAEMVCDWKARSNEQGTDLWEWVREKAPDRFDYPNTGRVYKEIRRFTELLLEKKFS